MKKINKLSLAAMLSMTSCVQMQDNLPVIPSLQYTKSLKEQMQEKQAGQTVNQRYLNPQGVIMEDNQPAAGSPKAQLRYVADTQAADEIITNDPKPDYESYESSLQDKRDYNGALSLGDPGVTSSLWRESRGTNDIFRDQRAWQPLDLITIVVTENSEGTKEADTEVKSSSTLVAAMEQFFTFDDDLVDDNPTKDGTGSKIDPSNLINATVQNDFKGEGDTSRKGSLKAKISAMVAEVLPSGILRIEGQKIISVNSEEQVMVISGLARPRDINFGNEIDSAKIANMRIDYYGKGIVAEAQYGGWLARLIRIIWPF